MDERVVQIVTDAEGSPAGTPYPVFLFASENSAAGAAREIMKAFPGAQVAVFNGPVLVVTLPIR